MDKEYIRFVIVLIIGIITSIYYKFEFNSDILIGLMLGLLVSYVAMSGTLKGLHKEGLLKDGDKE